ncbi:MAG: hypothetical protein ABSF34_03855 [Verrucomicrobiota bacterium]
MAKAESLALTDALLPDFLAGALAADVAAGFFPFAFAQRALWAAAILARAAALIVNFFFGAARAGAEFEEEPRMETSSFSNAPILSLRSAACFNCVEVSNNRLLMMGLV